MKAIKAEHRIFTAQELKQFKSRMANLSDASLYIDFESLVHVDGKPVAIYKKMNEELKPLLYACEAIDFPTYSRTNGMLTQTVGINYSPRNARRVNMCQATDLHVKNGFIHDVFIEYAKIIGASYKKYFSKAHNYQIQTFVNGEKAINKAYLINGTPFTGGVANKNSSLTYHIDKANTPDGISCMIIMKANTIGGELVLPELGISFACQDGYMLLFDGQKYLHGVTPIRNQKGGYRYSVVYYNNKGMALCLPPDEELKHFEEYNKRLVLKKENDEG